MRIIIASGFWNPIHVSHINYLNHARELGDYLYVIVNTDKQVNIKGSCPFQSEQERFIIIKNLKSVDAAILAIDKDGGVADTIEQIYLSTIQDNQRNYDLGFDNNCEYVFAKGGTRNPDNDAIPSKEVETCNKYGIKIEYGVGGFDKPTSSSSILKNVARWYNKDKVTFVLEGKELESASEFIEKHNDGVYIGAIGGRFNYTFTPTSIGTLVSISDSISKESVGITDFSLF